MAAHRARPDFAPTDKAELWTAVSDANLASVDRRRRRLDDACFDTDAGALDTNGNGCDWSGYSPDSPLYCTTGYQDDGDFTAMDMCCGCGGGEMDTTVDRRRRSALLHRGRVTGEGHPLRPPHVRAPQTLGHLWWRGRLLPQHIPDSSVQLGHRRRHLNPATGACRLMPITHTQVGWLRWCRACSAWVGGTPAGCRSETARALASNPTIPTHISSQKSRRDCSVKDKETSLEKRD